MLLRLGCLRHSMLLGSRHTSSNSRKAADLVGSIAPRALPDNVAVHEIHKLTTSVNFKNPSAAGVVSGAPAAISTRGVRIYERPRNAMQSGTAKTGRWILAFDTQPRWENSLIGWSSSADAMQGTQMEFPTREAALKFAKSQNYTVDELDTESEPGLEPYPSSVYARNFHKVVFDKMRFHHTK